MALQSRTITVGADKDVNNGGKNYVSGQVIYIKDEAGVLAPIFRDIDGQDPIAQNTISNVTNAKGQFTFFVEEGNYTAEYNDQSTPLFVFGADYFNNQIDFVTSQILSNTQPYSAGNFTDGFTFTELNQYGNATVNDGGTDYATTFWYIGGTLPHTVVPLTNPRDFPLLYQQRDFNSAEFLATKTTENAQDFIDSFALKIFQSPTDGLTEINTRTLLGGEVYEVRKVSDGSLADIYTNKEGLNPIAQDGTSNVSGNDGVVEFYIADGDYAVTVNAINSNLKVNSSASLTLGLAINSALTPLGSTVRVSDRGYAEFKKTSGLTPNGMDIIACTDGNQLELQIGDHELRIEQLGATGSILQNVDAHIIRAIELLRANPSEIQEGIGAGSPLITVYSSGTVSLGRGIYKVSPEVLDITQDIGLTIKGQGHSGSQNYKRGATTLLVDGASSTFGIRSKGNGGRSLRFERLDICYSSPSFTGRLLDNLDAVGLQLENVYIGCFGVTGADRLFTASSLVGLTYAEYVEFKNVVFNGAVNFIEFDNTRTIGGSTFGCSSISLENVVFYDCTGTMLLNDGTRTIIGLDVDASFNPITTNCIRALDLDNVDGLTLSSLFTPSTSATGSITEWVKIHNCTGSIKDCEFGSLVKAGTLNGDLHVSGNKIGGSDGFTVTGGNITGGGNEFRTGTNGWLFAPSSQLTIDLSPDRFDAAVTSSYYLPADSTLVSGQIKYTAERDNSSSKFEINTARVRLFNASKTKTVASTPTITSFTESGNIHAVGGLTTNMEIEIPAPRYCTNYKYSKFLDNPYTLTLNCPAGKNFICGESSPRTQAVATNIGSYIEFESLNDTTYLVTSLLGDWVFS